MHLPYRRCSRPWQLQQGLPLPHWGLAGLASGEVLCPAGLLQLQLPLLQTA